MLEPALRATAILVVAWTLTRVMPRATAATRHLVWHGAIVATLMLALASVAKLPVLLEVPKVPIALAMPDEFSTQVENAVQVIERTVALDITARPTAPDGSVRTSRTSTFATLSAFATVGTVAVGLWFTLGWIAAIRLSRDARRAPVAWQLEVNALCERLRIRREVRVRIIDAHSSPLATGVFRAVILLPAAAGAWTADRRRAVLLHELAHIKRADCRVQLVAQIACAIYWFHPLVWIAAARLRRERERACDDQVLSLGAQASSYAAHLLDIARDLRPTLRPSAALAMARPSELEGRLLSVLAAGRARVPFRATRWLVVTVLSLSTATALAATPATQTRYAAPSLLADIAPDYVVANDIMMSADVNPESRAQAEATLRSSDDPDDREMATLALAFTSGRDVIPALLEALTDADSQVREKAAIGLALRRDHRVVRPLIDAMSDRDSQVREKVAIALGTSGDARARDVLTRALGDPDSQVREKAASALVLLRLSR